jgi:sulfate adenylyltransferase subunit 2
LKKTPVEGHQLGTQDLNARRRQAVALRLEGQKLAAVTASTGLSAPTVIAAVKAYRQGGWSGVDVQPGRGRPPKDKEGLPADTLAALWKVLPLPPEDAGLPSHSLWNRQALFDWLQQQGCPRSMGSVGRLCAQVGIDPETDVPSPAERIGNAVKLHARERYVKAPDGGRVGVLCTRTARGQLRWLAFDAPLQAGHCLAFLARLLPLSTGPIELRLPGAARLLRDPELHTWLVTHASRLTIVDPEIGSHAVVVPRVAKPAPAESMLPMSTTLTHLQRLEAESIHIMREVVAEADKPVMLYSIGKDSAVMLHLAMKAFYPAKPPFPLLHVDTRWKFRDMYAFRERMVKELGLELITHVNPDGVAKDINPFTHGSAIHTDVMKTEGLKQALALHGFDAAFGGARRDEEKSRAKERIFSFRNAQHRWDPKNQRPELWKLYNARKHSGESLRIFPLSNWTELDVWQYIYLQQIPIVPLYFAAERPVVERNGTLIMVDDDRMPLRDGEVPMRRKVRFRTLGCYPLTGAIESAADTLPAIIQEMLLTRTSERQGRVIDHDAAASMEKKKQEGYF